MRRTQGTRGFTLLEILVAIAIFAFVAGAAMQTMSSADSNASSAKRARELRMLAERKLGEVLTFELHFDDNYDGDLGDDYPEFGDRFRGWKWKLEFQSPDPVFFGISSQDDAQYFFGAPTADEKAAAATPASGSSGTPGQPGQATKKGETQNLRVFTLKVSSPDDDGAGDSVSLQMFAPIVAKKAAGGTAAPGGK
jgi:prepilin-type N-terminal cleavage/methylation domain-containing protein